MRSRNKKTVVKKPTRSQLVKRLDEVFSKFIRQRDKGICVTCGSVQDWKYQQNGHYEGRGKYPTRWDEKNCHCQCLVCNMFKKGNYTSYSLFMLEKYGEKFLKDLHKKSLTIAKFSNKDLQDKIDYYKKKIL
jgi:hypothetical protein